MSRKLINLTRRLVEELEPLRFEPPVTHVYNPLHYARDVHEKYLRRYARQGVEAVLLGMNPGPFGMAQTGVPFGEVNLVRDWMRLEGEVEQPPSVHPKRPIQGFDCRRSEVSGARLWGWARDTFASPDDFFSRFFIVNYCPLVFMEESGKNRTPDKCPKSEREPLFEICDRFLRETISILKPEWLIGIGNFAESRAREVLDETDVKIGKILHPSPQSPAANKGWAEAATRNFEALGIRV